MRIIDKRKQKLFLIDKVDLYDMNSLVFRLFQHRLPFKTHLEHRTDLDKFHFKKGLILLLVHLEFSESGVFVDIDNSRRIDTFAEIVFPFLMNVHDKLCP